MVTSGENWALGVGHRHDQLSGFGRPSSLIQRKPRDHAHHLQRHLRSGASIPRTSFFISLAGTASPPASGDAVEYAGSAIRAMPIEGRLTICNMSIELGARSGLHAPDDATTDYLSGRPFAPQGALWDQAAAAWRQLPSDDGAVYDSEIEFSCDGITPQITWGTTPQEVIGVAEVIPDPAAVAPERRPPMAAAFAYMGLQPGMRMEGLPIDYAFIGSCTNSRLSDLTVAAALLRGRKVAEGVTAIVVPGSTQVKHAAEAAGLDKIFTEAGFQWRESGCSMCQTLGGDFVLPGKRSISTTNRNFEGRQGPNARTHLASPAMVAAAAVSGRIVDIRKWQG